MQDKTSRKGFENSKKLQIAEASMQLPSAIMGAYTSMVRIPYIGPFIAPIAAAAAGVFGAMQIKQIASQKFGGGTASAARPSTPSISMPSGGLNNYGGGTASGGGSTIVNNVILDGTVIHSSMIRANDGASQRGDRSFSTAA
jgi:tetrahydromethanopterin S-methyltransferase subunit C